MGLDLDAFEERAAIMEYDGGMSRLDAETAAAREQGYDRWQVVGEIARRQVARVRHHRKVAGQPGADDLPGVQPQQAKEE